MVHFGSDQEQEGESMNLRFLRCLLLLLSLLTVFWIARRACFDWTLYQTGHTFTIQKTNPNGYDSLLRVPKGYHDFSDRWPLLVFLHGAGEVGKDVSVLETKDPYYYFQQEFPGEPFPFLQLAPINDTGMWEPWRIAALIDELLSDRFLRFRIDPHRIYLTGFSQGGFGVFRTASEFPEKFAAIVPVAGGGEPTWAKKFRKIPIWNFHGEHDTIVPPPSSGLLLRAIEESGNEQLQETILSGAGHGIDREVYSCADLYEWLQVQHRMRQPP